MIPMKTNQARLSLFLILIVGIAFLGIFPVAAQAGYGKGMGNQGVMGPTVVREWFRSLNLTDKDLDKLEKILQSRELELVKAQNEIRILQTQIANILVDPDPDLKAIDEAISKSLQYEKIVRMIQIDRQIAIRKVFGEDRWQTILFLVHEARMSEKAGRFANSFSTKGLSAEEANRYGRLLGMLRRIM
jgi:Spy/CpxP family protein refolding chaperone